MIITSRAILEKYLTFDDKCFKAYQDLGIIYTGANRHKDAVDVFSQSLKLKPDEAISHKWLGIAIQNPGRHEEAVNALKSAVKLSPEPDPKRDLQLAHSLYAISQYREATKYYN